MHASAAGRIARQKYRLAVHVPSPGDLIVMLWTFTVCSRRQAGHSRQVHRGVRQTGERQARRQSAYLAEWDVDEKLLVCVALHDSVVRLPGGERARPRAQLDEREWASGGGDGEARAATAREHALGTGLQRVDDRLAVILVEALHGRIYHDIPPVSTQGAAQQAMPREMPPATPKPSTQRPADHRRVTTEWSNISTAACPPLLDAGTLPCPTSMLGV